jgi:hypothetical protein
MEISYVGLVAAASTFLGVWSGHVVVRKIESISRTLWLPTITFAGVGILFEWLSLITPHFLLSTTTGILGMTFLWDALEFTRQQNRIKEGHAPANPNNPRHAGLLSNYPAATTLDPLKRNPIGKPVSPRDATQLVTDH